MTEAGDGTLYGVVEDTSGFSFDGKCKTGCDVQRIDFDARVVRGQVRWVADVARIVTMKHDPFQKRVILGYLLPGASYDTFGGFRIVTFQP